MLPWRFPSSCCIIIQHCEECARNFVTLTCECNFPYYHSIFTFTFTFIFYGKLYEFMWLSTMFRALDIFEKVLGKWTNAHLIPASISWRMLLAVDVLFNWQNHRHFRFNELLMIVADVYHILTEIDGQLSTHNRADENKCGKNSTFKICKKVTKMRLCSENV